MTNGVEKLANLLGLNTDKTFKSVHHLKGKNFPFYTRNPERVKFEDPFNEIIGIITRQSLGKQIDIDDIEEGYFKEILNILEYEGNDITEEIYNLFRIDFNTINAPFLFQYYPSLKINERKKKELVGKRELGKYIVKLFRLDENNQWKEYISKKETTDLYEWIQFNSLPELSLEKKPSKENTFNFFDQEIYVEYFNKDLNNLMINENFFIKNIHLLISYYFFYYVVTQVYLLNRKKREKKELWFSYDKETLSAGRESVTKGYKIFNEISKELLINNDLVDYLNILSENENYQTMEEMLDNKSQLLLNNLSEFNQIFAKKIELEYEGNMDINFQISQLKIYIEKITSNETLTRYRKNFDEFSNLGFIKSRGRLGYVFNATQELILMFVGVIVGDENKILLNNLFVEFENRGLSFDKQSRKEITDFFEHINILEKLSDSGDAQYVKSIL